jgi:subtilase family serine protease
MEGVRLAPRSRARSILLLLAFCAAAFALLADLPGATAQTVRPLITQPVDDSRTVVLPGNIPPEANVANDRGAVPAAFPMEHMLLQLRRSTEQERALAALIDELHDRASTRFHRWLKPDEFGARFGLAATDLQIIAQWLRGHGFRVNSTYPNRSLIDFSGTAGQVRAAFGTEIHRLLVDGEAHIANMSNPRIPAALAPAVAGIVTLNDFRPKPQHVRVSQYSAGGGDYFVVPADLATIYNFAELFSGGISGQGQTVTVVEDTDLYTNADWTKFRATFGLSGYSDALLTTVHPGNCTDPGVNGDDGEAILDTEWASAAAPNATIAVASCANTVTYGFFLAAENLINQASPPAIISMSYGLCEAEIGATANNAIQSAYEQGVVEGISIFVSAGDNDAGVCTSRSAAAVTTGIGVNAFASTQYNVAVGGTDFSDTYSGTASTYWDSSNSSSYGSALSYIPEIPWNDSCASKLIALYSTGSGVTYGASGFCNSSSGQNFRDLVGGSGGPSACATGAPSTGGVVSGTCQGYAKPSWQTGVVGIPNDGVRDLPDVSLFAANGLWGHYFVFCYSDPNNGGTPCTGAPSGWSGAGGTSFSAPIMAGLQALVNQHTSARQGNPNYTYYPLAANEYGVSGSASCNSSSGNAAGASCIFYDVTLGDMDADCTGSHNCYLPSGTYGVLSTSNSAYQPAYATTTGWDFATGIGTVNAYNLVTCWDSCQEDTLTVSASPSAGGNVTGGGTFLGGSRQTVIATANSGYVFANWTENGSVVSTSASYTFTLTANVTLVANFNQMFTLAVSASPSAGGTVTGGGTFASGTSQTVKATAKSGYVFANWTQSGSIVSTSASYTFTLGANTTLVANFSKLVTLTVSASPAAGGTVAGGGTFAAGSSETVTATAKSGYVFADWTQNGTVVSTSASYGFTISANTALVANFTKLYTLTVSASPSADGSVAGGGTFSGGSSQTVVATANSGYGFVHWTDNATVVSSSASYTFTLNASTALVAGFTKVFTVALSASPSAGGTVTGAGTFATGISRTVKATANSGYVFINWTKNSAIVGTSASYTFTLGANVTLVANFKAVPATELSAAPNPSSFGQTVTFTAAVTSSSGTPTGTVTFKQGTTILSSGTLTSGAATFTTAALVTGGHSITAVYGGDANFTGGSGSTTLTVDKAGTATALTASPNPSTLHQTVTLTANVTSANATPGGTVTFKNGTTTLGAVALAAGKATLKIATLGVGAHQLTASYGGGPNFTASSGSVSQTVSSSANSATAEPRPSPGSL